MTCAPTAPASLQVLVAEEAPAHLAYTAVHEVEAHVALLALGGRVGLVEDWRAQGGQA